MKLFDVVLLSLAVGFFMIGVHQCFMVGVGQSYWIFMLVSGLILWFRYRHAQAKPATPAPEPPVEPTPGKKKKGSGLKK